MPIFLISAVPFCNLGVSKAVENVNQHIAPALISQVSISDINIKTI